MNNGTLFKGAIFLICAALFAVPLINKSCAEKKQLTARAEPCTETVKIVLLDQDGRYGYENVLCSPGAHAVTQMLLPKDDRDPRKLLVTCSCDESISAEMPLVLEPTNPSVILEQ